MSFDADRVRIELCEDPSLATLVTEIKTARTASLVPPDPDDLREIMQHRSGDD